ncbi:MAG: patatin-like phospholipase family protein [Nitrospira sp.]|nr:patatin-like phospholipase family protein [Nitrospira sp.]
MGLAISGGGSRAANFGAAVMLELQERGLLQQVDVISGVSGGTLPATYYGLGDKAGAFTPEAVRAALGFDFQSSWLWRWLLPQNIFRFWLTDFTRSDIMVQVFNKRLYHHATFADLRPHPKILLNATLRNDHTRFTFTDERFADLRSNLSRYRIANAVNASSAFPGAFDDVTLENYRPQNAEALAELGLDPMRYFHLYDGGPIDNLGVQAMLEYLNRHLPGKTLDGIFPNGCLILLVDATSANENAELNGRRSSRRTIDYFINTNALDATDTMLLESRRTTLQHLGIPSSQQDREMRGRLPVNDPHQCGCEVRHIALRHLSYSDEVPDESTLPERATRIKTKFWVSDDEQRDLFEAAHVLITEMEKRSLLPKADFKTHCEAQPNRD